MLNRLDLNQDAVINPQDAQVLYYLALPQSPGNLMTLLSNLNVANPGQDAATRLAALNLLGGIDAVAVPMLDLNRDDVIDLQDVRVLYYALRFEDILRASASLREILLSDLTVGDDEDGVVPDDEYLAMLDRAAALSLPVNVDEPPTAVTLSGTVTTLDENTSARTRVADIAVTDDDDGPRLLELVGEDAGLFELSSDQTELFLRAGQVLDFESDNKQLDVTIQVIGSNPAVAATLQITVTNASEVPTTGGDGGFRVFEGTRYTLSTDDLSARDPDDDAAALTWTVTEAPMLGQLELSTTPGTEISSFTQAQLEAGEVVYVPDTGSGGNDDGFVVRVADDQGNQANPVTVNVTIAGFLGNIDLTDLTATDGFIIQGDRGGVEDESGRVRGADNAGVSVSGAGDVNGDGFADLIVGADGGDDGGENAGEAYVVFGKASNPRAIDLTNLAAGDGFIIQGDAGGDRAGTSVSGAGDVNGDGFADLIVGASEGDDGGNNAGAAYVVFGKASGFGSMDSTGRPVVDLTNLDVGDGLIIQGDARGDNAGVSVSGAGDVNGDGFADLIVGARNGDDGDRNAGEAYVVFGKASGFGSPMDGRRVIELDSLTPADGFIIQGDAEGDQAGVSVSGAGDVNGDGYADLIVGARQGDDGGSNAGEAYLVFGKASGFGSEMGSRRVLDLDDLAPEDGFIIQGDAEGDQAGVSVSAAGDVNGDGYADLIVGAVNADVTRSVGGSPRTFRNAGEAYVLFGGPAGLSTETLAGDDVLSDDDNDGVVITGPGNDVLNIDGFTDTDPLRFDGGSGTDTLRLVNPDATTDLNLDLSTLPDTRLISIERIDLSGSGDNSLTLNRLDLLNLSEVRTEGRAELRVDGNAGDRVATADSGWVRGDDQTIEGNTYTVFNNGNARLLVNTALTLGGTLAPTSSATMPTMDEVLQQYATTHTVDIRAFIEDLPPEDEAQQRKRLEDELAMLGPLPAAKAAIELAEPTPVADPDVDLFDLPPLIPDEG